MDIPKEKLLWIYEKMLQIRTFEETMADEFAKGKIPGVLHLYAGEEAVAVGFCAHLRDEDYITSTHRGHGHTIAKGCDIKRMVAELYGKKTGLCNGKGGSMHIADVDKGMLGANGIVGGSIPMACGAALTAQYKKLDRVAVCFFGDGGSNQGTFHEGLNLASIWNLPVIFVAENNLYAEATPQRYHQKIQNIADRASSYNIPGVVVDGMDVFAVYEVADEAIRRARSGGGPTLVECKTYRFYGHYQGDAQRYRTKEEIAEYRKRDPIPRFRERVLSHNLLSEVELKEIEEKVKKEIQDAIEFAEKSEYPEPESTLRGLYATPLVSESYALL
jgi:pyruvate dehydrogenase E1 component alpha subunit